VWLCRLFFEAEGLFETVQMRVGEQSLMLKAADNDARGDAEFGGESFDALRAETSIVTGSNSR
jgi:hypothetical protein